MQITGYKSETQSKNLAWFLPRPKPLIKDELASNNRKETKVEE